MDMNPQFQQATELVPSSYPTFKTEDDKLPLDNYLQAYQKDCVEK